MFETILINPVAVVGAMLILAVLIVVVYTVIGGVSTCPTDLHRRMDGSLELRPTGQTFHDMNAFQQWWHAPGGPATNGCPIPLLTGAREVPVMEGRDSSEQTYAKTPINKVDDYELSRVFGYEQDGHMVMPRENYNKILGERAFDWADRPMTSDERRDKYKGLSEGFAATGELKSEKRIGKEGFSGSMTDSFAKEAVARYGERRGNKNDDDVECKIGREAREVAGMVAHAYESDPNWEPVVTKVGPHHWEVNELKPRRRHGEIEEIVVDERVVDTANDAVDVRFKYREKPVVEDAIDPYFGFGGSGSLPFESDRYSTDPFMGPVPGMQRMFGPTFDHKKWY